MDIRLVLVTFPDFETASEIGTQMVNSQLAACVNLLPGVTSIYRWQGAVEKSAEVLAVFKTSEEVWPDFEKELIRCHPYDTPEIIAISPDQVSPRYAAWLISAVDRSPLV